MGAASEHYYDLERKVDLRLRSRHLRRRQTTRVGRSPHLRLVTPDRALPEVLSHRDPELIREFFPWAAKLSDHYYRAEVDGVEHLSSGASMIVSTHNGSVATPDLYCLLVAFIRRFGLETPAYALAHKVALGLPVLGPMFSKLGGIPATPENGSQALRNGHPVLVFPGGDLDALKPYARRHEVVFGNRKGFVRLALRERVPIIPVVSVGAHEVVIMLNDGAKAAKALRFDKLFRLKTVPISLGFPFGLGIAGFGSVPLPSKIRLRVLNPITFDVPPSAVDDPEIVDRCFNEVRCQMQRALTDLATNRKMPLVG